MNDTHRVRRWRGGSASLDAITGASDRPVRVHANRAHACVILRAVAVNLWPQSIVSTEDRQYFYAPWLPSVRPGLAPSARSRPKHDQRLQARTPAACGVAAKSPAGSDPGGYLPCGWQRPLAAIAFRHGYLPRVLSRRPARRSLQRARGETGNRPSRGAVRATPGHQGRREAGGRARDPGRDPWAIATVQSRQVSRPRPAWLTFAALAFAAPLAIHNRRLGTKWLVMDVLSTTGETDQVILNSIDDYAFVDPEHLICAPRLAIVGAR